MVSLKEIYEFSVDLRCSELLRALIRDRYPGRVIASASLRARSIVALQLITEADPATPVVFCHAGPLYPESEDYRAYIIDRFGLSDVRTLHENESSYDQGREEHIEWIMASAANGGEVKQAMYLNRTLADFDCWLSSVYHMPRDLHIHHRIDMEGHLLRVNPLMRWTDEDIHRFMRAREIPYHKLAKRKLKPHPVYENSEPVVTYTY